ncbi:DUF58 domain-containing protein [Clostridium oryzae]|uniref:DUF58 domain-containing protein n=1 Tax=Clostridium oryzae TaxID=1450648 RepID=A0A1V4IRN1_9CLOT|nr:DUF58 domain-containing protein [Clostridium oryzae]OPJ62127.1 hypothetical protein CLORY_19500 [Clostridium oryzae]
MNITKRFIYILSIGILLLGLSFIWHNALTIFIIYDVICCALLIIDYVISEKDTDFQITRTGEETLSIYEEENISFEIYNLSSRRLNFQIIDEVPEFHFKAENPIIKKEVAPHQKEIVSYILVPTKRGAFTFKNVYVKFTGKLGLCSKMFKVDLSREYKIYPNIKNLRKYRLSICNNRAFRNGQRSLKTLGRGTAFESLREYVPGDEYRKINWKATARENKPIINQYEPEKNQHVYMFIDTGRSMSYTVRGYRKLDLAVNTALVMSDVVNQGGDKSGLLIFNTGVKNMIMPGKGAGHRNKMLEALYHIDYTNETSNYDEAFYHFKRKERHRSIVFMLTDFETTEEAEEMLKVLPAVSKNSIVVIIFIKNDKLEEMAARRAKNGEEVFNKGTALEMLQDRKRIISFLNRKGVFCIECEAEKVEFTAVNKYLEIKNKNYI